MHVTIDGRRIAYDDSGGPGVPLVLLHGFPLDRTVWDEQLPRSQRPACARSASICAAAASRSRATVRR